MLEILLFALVMMYSPGPVNMLSLFSGVSHYGWQTLRFCGGVALAMCTLFLLVGYIGGAMVTPVMQGVAASLGGLYIAYLALKLLIASYRPQQAANANHDMTFASGLIMQLTNPKAMIVVLPVVTVQFPNAHIEGINVFWVSVLLGLMAGGAPASYFLAGKQLKQLVLKPSVMSWVQRLMAFLMLLLDGQVLWDGVGLMARII